MLKDKFKHLTHDSYKPPAHPVKEVTTIQDNGKNYFLVPGGDELQLKQVLNHLSNTDRFAFDFESNTNDPMDRDPNAKIVGVSFAWAKGQACYLPIAHKHTEHNWPVEVLQRFKPFFESDQLKVAHHIKFERHWLKKHGIVLALPGFDPMLALNLMKKRYDQIGLKPAVYQILNHVMLTFKEVVYYDGNENRTFDEIPLDAKCLEYTCADSDEALQLVEPLTAQLKEDGVYDLFNDLDVPLAYSLVDIEQNGWYVDRDLLRSLGDTAEKKIAFLSKAINLEVRRQLRLPDDAEVIVPTGKTHKPLNLNSTNHLAWILYDQLKLPVLGKTDTGNPKVDADILEKLGMRYQIPLFDMILEYKKYQKINSTYVKGYGGHVREDNRIHTTLDMVFVRTGRFSSSAPNLQNCPRADNDPIGIRNMFVAPSKENALSGKDSLLLFSDYAQIELKIFAWYSGDPKMREAFFTGQDIHSRTAWEMFELGKPFEMDGHMCDPITVDEVTTKAKIFRQYAKAINFGIIYGLSAKGLAEDLWQNSDDEHVRRAQGLLNRYFERYRRIIPYQTQTIATARNLGYTETMFGRIRMIPEIQSRNYGTRGYGERMALNTPIQGSASEIIKLAMVEIWKNRPADLSMIMQIHDEIVTETPAESLIHNARYIKQAMEVEIPGFDIPILAECDVGYRWGEKRGITFTDNGIKVKVKPTDEELVRRLEMAGAEIVVAS